MKPGRYQQDALREELLDAHLRKLRTRDELLAMLREKTDIQQGRIAALETALEDRDSGEADWGQVLRRIPQLRASWAE